MTIAHPSQISNQNNDFEHNKPGGRLPMLSEDIGGDCLCSWKRKVGFWRGSCRQLRNIDSDRWFLNEDNTFQLHWTVVTSSWRGWIIGMLQYLANPLGSSKPPTTATFIYITPLNIAAGITNTSSANLADVLYCNLKKWLMHIMIPISFIGSTQFNQCSVDCFLWIAHGLRISFIK